MDAFAIPFFAIVADGARASFGKHMTLANLRINIGQGLKQRVHRVVLITKDGA